MKNFHLRLLLIGCSILPMVYLCILLDDQQVLMSAAASSSERKLAILAALVLPTTIDEEPVLSSPPTSAVVLLHQQSTKEATPSEETTTNGRKKHLRVFAKRLAADPINEQQSRTTFLGYEDTDSSTTMKKAHQKLQQPKDNSTVSKTSSIKKQGSATNNKLTPTTTTFSKASTSTTNGAGGADDVKGSPLTLSNAASSKFGEPTNRTARGGFLQKSQSGFKQEQQREQPAPSLQVFLVAAPGKEVYRERLLANARGWHRQFPYLPVFTFDDKLPVDVSTLVNGSNIHHLPLIPPEKNEKRTNLLLAAFGAMYQHNPNADYYFMAEDDTVLVKKNIEEAVARLGHRKGVYYGKCVSISTKKYGKVNFVMGGAGILMSGDMLRLMVPGIRQCRMELKAFQHGDARIAVCLMSMKLYPKNFCSDVPQLVHRNGGFHFSSASPWRVIASPSSANAKVVTMHEKDPERIDVLNNAIDELMALNRDITWSSLKPYLEKFAGNRTDMY